METNILNIEITRPNQVLIIMRGISGSGKSFVSNTLVGDGIIHSTDAVLESFGDYNNLWENMKENSDTSLLSKAHSINLKSAIKSMVDGISPIVIDNTNIKANDPKAYVVKALELGFSEKNIQIIDIGSNGFTPEQLVERNAHNVPLEVIEKMVQVHKSVGPLTIEKILDSKNKYGDSDVLYSCILLNVASRNLLIENVCNKIPSKWDVHCHHMTLRLGGLKDKSVIGETEVLRVTHVGLNDKAMAVKVEGFNNPTKNAIPHITVAVNPDGGKPVMSNDITKWQDIKQFNVIGVVTEIKRII